MGYFPRWSAALLIAGAAYGVGAVQAQDAEVPCGGDHGAWLAEHADAMGGTWIDTPVMGLMQGQPFPMLGGPEPVEMTPIPNGFSTVGEEPPVVYEILLTDAPFAILPPGGTAELARIDAEDVPGCALADLPHLSATYRMNIDGDMVDGTIVAVVAAVDRMHVWFGLDSGFGRIEMLSVMTR